MIANAVNAPTPAAQNIATCWGGTRTRCGCQATGAAGLATVSGIVPIATAASTSTTRTTRYGSTRGCPNHSAIAPPNSGPSPSPPRFATPPIVAAIPIAVGRVSPRKSRR